MPTPKRTHVDESIDAAALDAADAEELRSLGRTLPAAKVTAGPMETIQDFTGAGGKTPEEVAAAADDLEAQARAIRAKDGPPMGTLDAEYAFSNYINDKAPGGEGYAGKVSPYRLAELVDAGIISIRDPGLKKILDATLAANSRETEADRAYSERMRDVRTARGLSSEALAPELPQGEMRDFKNKAPNAPAPPVQPIHPGGNGRHQGEVAHV